MRQDETRQEQTKGYCWLFTLNNPTDLDRAKLTQIINWPECVKRVRGQDERGAETGTLHIQGVIQLYKQQRRSYIKKWLERCWCAVAESKFAVENYVEKEETAIPGTRFDISREEKDYMPASSSDSVATADREPLRYLTPASLPKYLAFLYKKIQEDEGDSFTPLCPEAAVELCLRHAVASGIDCLHVATPALIKSITKHWFLLLGATPETSSEWYRIDAARNGIEVT